MHACINQDKPVVGILSSWDFVLAPDIPHAVNMCVYIYVCACVVNDENMSPGHSLDCGLPVGLPPQPKQADSCT